MDYTTSYFIDARDFAEAYNSLDESLIIQLTVGQLYKVAGSKSICLTAIRSFRKGMLVYSVTNDERRRIRKLISSYDPSTN